MTNQEKAFVDEYVFQLFNSGTGFILDNATEALKRISIDSEDDISKQIDELMNRNDIDNAITEQVNRIKEKLSGKHRRELWKAIIEMDIQNPSNEFPDKLPMIGLV